MEVKKVDLLTINNGAAVELFAEEFQKVMRNINDVSVKTAAPREIKLVFKITPTEDRLSASVQIEATSKMVAVAKHSGSLFLSNRQNGIEAYVTNPHQELMDFEKKSE